MIWSACRICTYRGKIAMSASLKERSLRNMFGLSASTVDFSILTMMLDVSCRYLGSKVGAYSMPAILTM